MLGSDLISVINEVHDALAVLDVKSEIDLPQIAVVGSQSSGKSSVLEALVGRDFLPRGSGIVTRCPLVLKLTQRPADSPEWGEFTHKPGVKFDDFMKIRSEIEARTQSIAGPSAISSTPISLTVFSPKVLNLTLIDLPGMVTTAVGDQPRDIERQIKEMVMSFIRPENTIILAISPANADIANSVALKAARVVDPDFNRTIGVLTKLDIMDEGTHALDILEGRLIPLRRGWIGVVNRSQKAINENRSMEDAKEAERQYFMRHADYRAIASRQGTDFLAKTMSALLLGHIQRCLPDLRSRIDDLVKQTRKKQEELGLLDDLPDPASRLLQLFAAFTASIKGAIEGDVTNPQTRRNNELYGGARLDYIFHEAFARYVTGLTASSQLTTDKMRTTIRNSAGLQSNLFPSDRAFLTLTREQVSRLEEPSLQCVTFVHEELRKLCMACAAQLDRYPTLKEKVVQIAYRALDEFRSPCVAHVRTMMQSETLYINVRNPRMQELVTSHFAPVPTNPELAPGQQPPQQQQGQPGHPGAPQPHPHAAQRPQVPPQRAAQRRPADRFEMPSAIQLQGDLSAKEHAEHSALKDMVEGYFSLCKDTVCDQIPKIVNCLMVQQLCMEINARLMKALFKEDLFEELISESPQVASMRKATTKMMVCLTKAQEALDRVRDLPLPVQ